MNTKNTRALLPLAALVLAGCASNSGVQPLGNDTYFVSRQAPSGFHGMGTLKADALKEAYARCAQESKVVEILESTESKPPYLFGNFPKVDIRFRCVPK